MRKFTISLFVFLLLTFVGIAQQITISVDSQIDPKCHGGYDGYIGISAYGGSGTYIYQWSNGSSTSELFYINAGTYNVTVIDSQNPQNQSFQSVTLVDPPALSYSNTMQSPSCNGMSNGSMTVIPEGGVAPYTYYWSDNTYTNTINNLSSQNYYYFWGYLYDSNNCSVYMTVPPVSEPSPLSISFDAQLPHCDMGDGSVFTTVSGGTMPYTYQWNDSSSQTGSQASNLFPGSYRVTVTDVNGCITTGNYILNNLNAPTLQLISKNISCNGANDGSIKDTLLVGNGPFVFNWSNGANTSSINGLQNGNYSLTVTDVSSCKSFFSTVILEPEPLDVYITVSNVACYGSTGGGAMWAYPSGGTGNYYYAWSNSIDTYNNENIGAGVYSLTVTDDAGCTKIISDTVMEPSSPISATIVKTSPICFNSATGSLDITVTGGVPPYSYYWYLPGGYNSWSEDVTGVYAGQISYSITDSYGCNYYGSDTLFDPPQMQLIFDAVNPKCYNESSGSIDLTVVNGTSPYSYIWTLSRSPQKGSISMVPVVIGQTEDIDSLAWGSYFVTVTDSNGCSITGDRVLIDPYPINVEVSGGKELCGDNSGFMDVYNIYNAVGPVSYEWSTSINDTLQHVDSLYAGLYHVTVTDSLGCKGVKSYALSDPTNFYSGVNFMEVKCHGDSSGYAWVDATLAKALPGVVYSWSTGETNDSIFNLHAGAYSVSVIDTISNCMAVHEVVVTDNPPIEISKSLYNVSCYGLNNGYIYLDVTGGYIAWGKQSYMYNFSWSHDSTAVGNELYDLAAGTYYVTVSDGYGCEKLDTIVLTQPDPVIVDSIKVTNPSCYGYGDGAIAIYGSGGNGPMQYSIDGGEVYSSDSLFVDLYDDLYNIGIRSNNGEYSCYFDGDTSVSIVSPDMIVIDYIKTNVSCSGGSNGQIEINVTGGSGNYTYSFKNYVDTAFTDLPGNIVSGLPAGYYEFNVGDGNNCKSGVGEIHITEPAPIYINGSVTAGMCYGDSTGKIITAVTGGNSPYHYNWSNGDTVASLLNIQAGIYFLTVTDSLGCSAIDSFEVTTPDSISFNASMSNIDCYNNNNGWISISLGGGYGNLSFYWNDTAQQMYRENLSAGVYSVTATDEHNCLSSRSFEIINPPQLLALSYTKTDITCYNSNDATVTLSASGGTGVLSFSVDGGNVNNTGAFTNITPGTYFPHVYDINNCVALFDSVVIENPLEITMQSENIGNISCAGGNDGYIDLLFTGGTGNIRYKLNGGAPQYNGNFTNLSAGDYSIVVVDTFGCGMTLSYTLTEPPLISLTMSSENVLCNGGNDGSATVFVSGGTPAYSYNWSNGGTGYIASGLTAGDYTVAIIDALGCRDSISVTITEPSQLSATIQPSVFNGFNVSCSSGSDGYFTVNATGGVGIYEYSINGLTYTQSNLFDTLSAGYYNIIVRDTNACVYTTNIDLTEPSAVSTTAQSYDVLCYGGNSGAVDAHTLGGVPGYSYSWAGLSSTDSSVTGLSAGSYSFTVTDLNGCTAIATGIVIQPEALIIDSVNVTNLSCFENNDGSMEIYASGGVQPYSYALVTGVPWTSSSVFSGLPADLYAPKVKDANDCVYNYSLVSITQPDSISIAMNPINVVCYNTCNGAISSVVIGGTMPYTYSWSTGDISQNIINLCAGNYNLSVYDANNCFKEVMAEITQPAMMEIVLSSVETSCNGCTGQVTTQVTGGVGPYIYNWSNLSTGQNLSNVCAGTYHVSATDVNGCYISDSSVVTSLDLSLISGTASVTFGNIPDNSVDAELYRLSDGEIAAAEFVTSAPLVNSSFEFTGVNTGNYIIKMNVTTPSLLPNVLSTYYDTTVYWYNANVIPVTCAETHSVAVSMVETPVLTGAPTGNISGYITLDEIGGKGSMFYSGPKAEGEPIPGAEIYVELEPDDEPIANTVTNDTGYYSITGLISGYQYSVIVDIPGLPLITTYTNLDVSSDSSTFVNMNFIVDTTGTDAGIYSVVQSSVKTYESSDFSMKVYPNPFSEKLVVDYSLPNKSYVTCELVDITGKVVYVAIADDIEPGAYSLNIETRSLQLTAGTYFMKFKVNNSMLLKKLINIE